MENLKNKLEYFCIFGGGAIRGLSYIGVLKALEEKKVSIKGYAGSSAGAIAAVIASAGYNADEMADILKDFDYMLFRDINISFKIELAISKGEVFTDRIREIISKKLKTDKPVLFKDFPNDLYIITSNLTSGKSFVFSKETTPDFEVAQAVRISAGFPGLMNPYEIDNEYFVDGDLAKAYALSQISPLLNPKKYRILEFRLEGSSKEDPTKNPIEYVNNSVDFLTHNATDNVLNLYKDKDRYDFVVIETKETLLFDFSISQEQKDKLVELGYLTTKNFFEKTLYEKKKKLLPIYKELFLIMQDALELFEKYEYKLMKEKLYEYVALNHQKLDVVDENILEFVNEILIYVNEKVKRFLFLNYYVEKKQLLLEMFNSVLKMLDQKVTALETYLNQNNI